MERVVKTMNKPKNFNFKKKPVKPMFTMWLAKQIISWPDLKKRNFTYETVNMEGLKPPYLLLCNHASMVDFSIMLRCTHPYPVNNVMTLEGFHDYTTPLMRSLGVLGKRKFIKDYDLIKNIKYCLHDLNTIFCLFPEARYSLDGSTSFLPDSLGKMCRMMKVPVVTLNIRGSFVSCPQWNKIDKHNHVEAVMTQIITAEEASFLPAEEMNRRIREALSYDDWTWQKEHNIVIDHPRRADGLHSILYQCPHCQKEFEMYSEGVNLQCKSCGKIWELTELGELRAIKPAADERIGECVMPPTEFTHIPDWFLWERENVRREILEGTYVFEDTCRIETLPNAHGFKVQPDGYLRQDCTGTHIKGIAYGEEFTVDYTPGELESMHVEYDYHGHGDCVDLSTQDDSYWCYPKNSRDVITKLSIATEELHLKRGLE